MKKACLIYFSATGTTQKVLHKIAEGTGIKKIQDVDITLLKNRDGSNLIIEEDALVIIGVPVHMGRVPKTAVNYLKQFKGNGQPTICVAVYGNRNFDDALVELVDISAATGLNIMGAAAFIGEHSFSDSMVPIAAGRPDECDINSAVAFGKKIAEKLSGGHLAMPEVKGKRPYSKPMIMPKMAPRKTRDCNLCLACKASCPVEAIDDQAICNKSICITCNACVKKCPTQSRKLKNPLLSLVKRTLAKNPRKEPELFV